MSKTDTPIIEKFQVIADDIRQRVAVGDFKPGQRLPAWEDIERDFGVSRITVKRAMDELRHQGLVRTVQRGGTFIADQPPSLWRYAVAMRSTPRSRFELALHSVLRDAWPADHRHEWKLYTDVDGSSHTYRKLINDLRQQKLAGVILVHPNDPVQASELVRNPQRPTVALTRRPFDTITSIYPDYAAFYRQAAEQLLTQGCRTAALLANHKLLKDALTQTKRVGITVEPACAWGIVDEDTQACRHWVESVFTDPRSRPDGLIIGDDALAEPTQAALIAAGVRVPEHTRLIQHCNWPTPVSSVLPATRLGFDARQLLAVCMDQLRASANGTAASRCVAVPPAHETQRDSEQSSSPVVM